MASGREKRSSQPRAAVLGVDQGVDPRGVGARRPDAPPRPRGGGYQGTRTGSNVADLHPRVVDARIDELRMMGLSAEMLRVAEAIGFEAFDKMWRILDSNPANHIPHGGLEIRMRSYRSYLRFQRNRYIESLMQAGLSLSAIHARLKAELGEEITLPHISKIGRRHRVRPA